MELILFKVSSIASKELEEKQHLLLNNFLDNQEEL